MKCRYHKKVFKNEGNGYCVYTYVTDDSEVPAAARNRFYKGTGIAFTAVGISLPDKENIEVDLGGTWVNGKHGLQLSVESYQEILPQTEDEIEAYLASGMVKGIGPRTAERIVAKFGSRTFEVLEQYPDSLLDIKGITPKKLETILSSYQASHVMRELAAYLAPFKVTPAKIGKIYESFGGAALETVKNQPFLLCRINGFGFLTVDEIARAASCNLSEPMRIEGGISYCMDQIRQEGHLYQEKELFQKKVHELLNVECPGEVVTELEISREIYRMVKEKTLYYEDGALYPAKLYGYECGAAKRMAELLTQKTETPVQIDFLLAEAQKELNLILSEKQKEGVKRAFENLVSIITGGPGTGKTTVQKVLLYIHRKLGGRQVLLTAPTGRASRRMAESTGYKDAVTMHSAMGLTNDEEVDAAEDMLEADFVIADEFTMSDMRLSYELFCHIKKGARVVLVGDVNQLPSVGPGNVFRELVQCGVIPVTVLDMVFRQAENSQIIMNAHRMQENIAALDYSGGFQFIPAENAKEAAEKIGELYRASIDAFGTDKVQVLTPYRKSGEASVNALNEKLWEIANPKQGKAEIRYGKRCFRVGDRIIHNKNKNDISNGDIGYVTDILLDEDGMESVRLEFSEGRFVEYSGEELEMIEHAYATTIHKSQGSEYPMVIMPWLPMFYKMLRRNILYTGVTRAKTQVVIVGSKKAVVKAIHNTESDRRNTRLGERIVREYNNLLKKESRLSAEHNNYEQLAINL